MAKKIGLLGYNIERLVHNHFARESSGLTENTPQRESVDALCSEVRERQDVGPKKIREHFKRSFKIQGVVVIRSCTKPP